MAPTVLLASDKDSWHTTMGRMWPQFMTMPLHDEDHHPCSFSAIFADPFSASFYSLTWAEVGHRVWSFSFMSIIDNMSLRAYCKDIIMSMLDRKSQS